MNSPRPETRSRPTPAAMPAPVLDLTAAAIHAAQRGRSDGWRYLHDSTERFVRSLVWRDTGHRLLAREEIDDLVAEVRLNMFTGLSRLEYRGRRAFMGWIGRLVRSTLAARADYHDALKRGTRPLSLSAVRSDGNDSLDADEGGSEMGIPSPEPGPLAAVMQRDQWRQLMASVEQLTVGERRFVEQILTHGLDMKAIGCGMGLSTEAARMRWVRLGRKLREMVEARELAA